MTEADRQLDGVLSGTRVLDFGRYIAGPYCAALLGGGFSLVAAYLVLVAMLFVRPWGLFGRPTIERV